MNCVFCNNPCTTDNPGAVHLIVERCNTCPYVVKHFRYVIGQGPPEMLEYLFTVPYKGKRWTLSYCLNSENGSSPNMYDIINADEQRLHPVVELDFIPNITPYNVLEKLPMLLVFS